MRDFFAAAGLLLADLASTVLYLAVFLATGSLALAVGLGIALGVAQVGYQLWTGKPIEPMTWLSLALVVATGTTALLLNDPRIIMIKPSIIYAIVGAFMLKPGWLNRYLPPIATKIVPDIARIVGFCWAGLMIASAALNLYLALNLSPARWAAAMSIFGIASKVMMFLATFGALRIIARQRIAALPVAERDQLLAAYSA
jgi:intracellular septation protein